MKYSVVICTYNPDRLLLAEVLQACRSQTFDKASYEIILVDNNSDSPLSDDTNINGQLSGTRVVTERQQGLVHARLKGVAESKSENIVFVDDDNVLDKDYLKNLAILHEQYQHVMVWGPGVIDLRYLSVTPRWIKKNFGYLFQERHHPVTMHGSFRGWKDYFPTGSGMAVSKMVLNEFRRRIEEKRYSAVGRTGSALSSGEDAQLIWTAIDMGFEVGSSPALKLEHLIPAKRTTTEYLTRLNAELSRSYHVLIKEVFPDITFSYGPRSAAGRFKHFLKAWLDAGMILSTAKNIYAIRSAWPKAYESLLENN